MHLFMTININVRQSLRKILAFPQIADSTQVAFTSVFKGGTEPIPI